MAKGATTALDVIKKIFQNTALPWDAIGSLYVSLHTADPSAGNQTTNETAYSSYARQAVTRDVTGWTAANPTQNVALITFPPCGVTGSTVTHVAIGTVASAGVGQMFNEHIRWLHGRNRGHRFLDRGLLEHGIGPPAPVVIFASDAPRVGPEDEI